MNKTWEGIVLANRDYRENDAILTVCTQDEGIQSLTARGIRRISSKNSAAVQEFTHARFLVDFHEHSNLHAMRTADVIHSHHRIRFDLDKQSVGSVMLECVMKADWEEDSFGFLDQALTNLEQSDQLHALLALFFSCMNRKLGIEPFADGCVCCQRSDEICAISLYHGGFVCRHCFDPGRDTHYDKVDLKSFRLLCHAPFSQFHRLTELQQWRYEHVLMVYRFFAEYSGIRIQSMRFLNHLQELSGRE